MVMSAYLDRVLLASLSRKRGKRSEEAIIDLDTAAERFPVEELVVVMQE